MEPFLRRARRRLTTSRRTLQRHHHAKKVARRRTARAESSLLRSMLWDGAHSILVPLLHREWRATKDASGVPVLVMRMRGNVAAIGRQIHKCT